MTKNHAKLPSMQRVNRGESRIFKLGIHNCWGGVQLDLVFLHTG